MPKQILRSINTTFKIAFGITDVLMRNDDFEQTVNIINCIVSSFVRDLLYVKLEIHIDVGNAILNKIIVGASGPIVILFLLVFLEEHVLNNLDLLTINSIKRYL